LKPLNLSLVTTPTEKLSVTVTWDSKKPGYVAGWRHRPPSACRQ